MASGSQNKVVIVQQAGLEARGDFQVSPPRLFLRMQRGETKTVDVNVTSYEGDARTYTLGVEDFSMNDDDTNEIEFHENNDGPFSARRWISLPTDDLSLSHGERATLPVTVAVPPDAEAGDHYAVVLVRRDPKASGSDKSSVLSRAGALFFITVDGEATQSGELRQFAPTQRMNWSLPASFFLQYRNPGSTHVLPSGHVDIKNAIGMTVDTLLVTDWYVLRNSMRSQEMVWHPRFALGYYTATLRLQGFETSDISERHVSFWVVPLFPLTLVVLCIFIVSFLIQAIRSHRE